VNWNRVDKYAERSECGRYSICAIGFEGGNGGFFEGWRSRKHAEGVHLVATNLKTAAEARELCEQDSREDT
jgi:hypothetical protein